MQQARIWGYVRRLATSDPDSPFVGLDPAIRRAIEARGFSQLTTIQKAVLEQANAEQDLRLASQTGSGKTVAFGLSLAPRLVKEEDQGNKRGGGSIQALIVTPTRELAVQVGRELQWLFEGLSHVSIDVVTGGTDLMRERRRLRDAPTILVATPGRLLDHVRAKAIDLSKARDVILDEADQMLDMGFRDELFAIEEALPESRRSILVSATFPKNVRHLADRFQRDPLTIDVAGKHSGASQDIEHVALVIPGPMRYPALVNSLLHAYGERALIFVRRREDAADLAERLASEGLAALPFSGDLNQNQRTRTLAAFRSGAVKTLVATDVAARGIDVAGIGLVVHYDPPQDPAVYVHRSGRTGRAGAKGRSVLLVHERGQRRAKELLTRAKVNANWPSVPSPAKLERALTKACRRTIYENFEPDKPQPSEAEVAYAQTLLEEMDPATLVAHLVRMATPKYPCEPKSLDAPDPQSRDRGEQRKPYRDARGPRGRAHRDPRRGGGGQGSRRGGPSRRPSGGGGRPSGAKSGGWRKREEQR